MNTFRIRFTQNMFGTYEGFIDIKAKNESEALEQISSLNNDDINNLIEWSHMDNYHGDINSIKMDNCSIIKDQSIYNG